MLKRVTLKNFVNFKSAQTLIFGEPGDNGGVFMFVGANGSGKSTVFEAIRRCSEVRINDSISSRKREEYSMTMCLYENPENPEKGTMVSYYMVWENENEQAAGTSDGSADSGSKKSTAMKVLIKCLNNKSVYDHSLIWSEWSDEDKKVPPWKPYKDPSLDESVKTILVKFAEKEIDDTQCNNVADILKKIHTRQKDHKEDAEFDIKFRSFTDKELDRHNEVADILKNLQDVLDDNNKDDKPESKTNDDTQQKKVDAILGIMQKLKDVNNKDYKQHTSESDEFDGKFRSFTDIEFLFGHRGISPIQSSKQLDNTKGLDPKKCRYEQGMKNAYIIRQFLETSQPDDLYDTDIKKKIFGLVTSERDEFTLDDKKQIVFGPKKAPLLKISEGIVEAECISILLSKKATRTLMLEEPGRGMHKHYVDSMVHRVFLDDRFTNKKTIILSTHNRDFLTSRTLDSTFFFKWNVDGDSEIRQLTEQHNKKTRKFITYADAPNIFFSKRTLFVEGLSDSLFVTMIKEILLESASAKLVERICDGDEDEDAQNKFKDFLATLSIVRLDGATNMKKPEDICKDLGITSRLYLFDEDQKDDLTKLLGLKEGDDRTSIFVWKCECQNKKERKKHPKKKHVKVKKGDLEDALLNQARMHDKRYHPAKGKSHRSCKFEGCEGMTKHGMLRFDCGEEKALLQLDPSQDVTDLEMRRVIEEAVDNKESDKESEVARFLKFLKDKSEV